MSEKDNLGESINKKKPPIKRFIAGAVCPKCAQMDKLTMYRISEGENSGEFRECVSCGFSEKLVFKPQVRELDTRVNVTEEQKKSEIQVLNFPAKDS